eukprot:1654373-Prymnesium_polylepis.1
MPPLSCFRHTALGTCAVAQDDDDGRVLGRARLRAANTDAQSAARPRPLPWARLPRPRGQAHLNERACMSLTVK